MIRRITDRFLVWLIAAALMWALLVQPAFTQLGKKFEQNYHPNHSALCPAEAEHNGC
jgi:hypothetical protein